MAFKETDVLALLKVIWEWVFRIKRWNTPEGWCARIVVWFFVVYLILVVARHILGLVAKIAESWTALGFKFRNTPEELAQLRRRQQFSKVLASDLATLAKAENWNDQFFTDLEAEVEAEGGYYASASDRMLHRKSFGLRRVPSLIEAIESSTEQCLLVTGEPGSGKSVALRHLAAQLAERASRSKSDRNKIPLYLNLKELPPAPPGGPSADFVKTFVLENIRRGDADTAAYVRENWSIHREEGTWFFLFDSFDEIPAVLHAATGSPVIRQHADAIRQFFEGISECRGVLASREFKGPDALRWNKFRILSLSLSKQEQLIENSFLPPSQKAIALQHTANSGQSLLTNPLFLTLLCRYVKEQNRPPANDNELLLRHIQRLAEREPEYIFHRYNLLPQQLLDGSMRLAVLFAERPQLSLAPTQDQISQFLPSTDAPGGDLDRLVAALIDVKIGRCDVKEARPGDRRFTFGHRRYQEALFVQFLLRTPGYLTPQVLLTDLRWREYAVTMLQTSSAEVAAPLLAEATRLLSNYRLDRRPLDMIDAIGPGGSYLEWSESPAVKLLQLLQEGLSSQLEIVPGTLRDEMQRFLSRPWADGDAYDRLMCLSLGGLLPESDQRERINWAIKHGTIHHWDVAIANSCFLRKIPDDVSVWFRQQLANRILFARTRAEILKFEAIAARLPSDIGSKWIVSRISKIRKVIRIIDVSNVLARRNMFLTYIDIVDVKSRISIIYSNSIYILMLSIIFFKVVIDKIHPFSVIFANIFKIMWILLFAKLLYYIYLFTFRDIGEKLTYSSIIRVLHAKLWSNRPLMVLRAAIGIIAFWLLVGALIYWVARFFGYVSNGAGLVVFGPLVPIVILAAIAFLLELRRRLVGITYLKLISPKIGPQDILMHARSWAEMRIWLQQEKVTMIPSIHYARCFLRFIEIASNRTSAKNFNGKSIDIQRAPLPNNMYRYFTRITLTKLFELSVKPDPKIEPGHFFGTG